MRMRSPFGVIAVLLLTACGDAGPTAPATDISGTWDVVATYPVDEDGWVATDHLQLAVQQTGAQLSGELIAALVQKHEEHSADIHTVLDSSERIPITGSISGNTFTLRISGDASSAVTLSGTVAAGVSKGTIEIRMVGFMGDVHSWKGTFGATRSN